MAVIISKPGIISKEKQDELSDAGYIVIEADDPNHIFVLDETPSIDRDVILDAAISALGYGNDSSGRLAFGDLIRKRLTTKRQNEE